MYELSPETKQAISKTVGLPWETLVNMTIEEEIEYVEKMLQSIDSYQGENWIEKEVM